MVLSRREMSMGKVDLLSKQCGAGKLPRALATLPITFPDGVFPFPRPLAPHTPRRMSEKKSTHPLSKKFARYPRLNPLGIGRSIRAADLIDETFLAYNGGRLQRACRLL